MLLALALLLGSNTAFSAKLRCEYQKMEDLSVARDAKGKKRKGFYIDDFTKELLVSTSWEEIEPDTGPTEKGMKGHAAMSVSSRGDETIPETQHDKVLNLDLEMHTHSKTFPDEDEIQQSIFVPTGGELLIAMADHSVVTLYSGAEVVGEASYDTPEPHSGNPFVLKFKATFNYTLDAAAQSALTTVEARAVRVRTNKGDLDIRLSRDDRDAFQKAVACVNGGAK